MTAQQLKSSILQMAVQGKLVPQDPSDEPASILIKRIFSEKERLIKEKKIRREKNPSYIFRGSDGMFYEIVGSQTHSLADKVPFEMPESWELVRLSSIGDWRSGATPSRSNPEYYNGNIPWLKTGDLNDGYINSVPETISKRALDKTSVRLNPIGSVLIAMYGATIGKLGILNISATTNQACCACSPLSGIYNKYLFYFLMSYKSAFIKQGEGGAQPNISKEKIVATLMPLPPLAEQHRIIQKIESILPHLLEYDEKESSLRQLNNFFPDSLKKSILQWAVQGKLMPQNQSDEPASVLLEYIRKGKAQLIKEGKIKKTKQESIIYRKEDSYYEKTGNIERCIDDEIPFEIPNSWEWARLDAICEYIQRGKSPKYSPIKKFPVIAQKCNQWSGFSIEKAKFIEPSSLASYVQERILQDGDLMWNSTGLGTLGRIAMYKTDLNPYELAVADSHVTVIRPLKDYISPDYLYYYFSNPSVQNIIEKLAEGTTNQKELATATVKAYLIPLPPMQEQLKVVNKVQELIPLIKSM